jgi:hypothetical protein
MDGVLERIEQHGDLFEPVLPLRQELEHALRAGEARHAAVDRLTRWDRRP